MPEWKIKYLICYFFLSNHSGKGMKNQPGDSVIIIYLSTNAFSVKIYRYRNVLCRSSTRHRHSIKRKDIAWHFSPKQIQLTIIFADKTSKHICNQFAKYIYLRPTWLYFSHSLVQNDSNLHIFHTHHYTILWMHLFQKSWTENAMCKHGYRLINHYIIRLSFLQGNIWQIIIILKNARIL